MTFRFSLCAALLMTAALCPPAFAHEGGLGGEEHHTEFRDLCQGTANLNVPGDTIQYAPASWVQGVALLREGRALDARDTFEAALDRAPHDPLTLWGLWRAWVLIDGEGSRVEVAYDAFRAAWRGGATPRLERL